MTQLFDRFKLYEFYLKAGFTEKDELSAYFINEKAKVFKYSLEVNEKFYYLNNVYELN